MVGSGSSSGLSARIAATAAAGSVAGTAVHVDVNIRLTVLRGPPRRYRADPERGALAAIRPHVRKADLRAHPARRIGPAVLLLATLAWCPVPAAAAGAVSHLLFDGAGGATCDFFNEGVRIRWRQRLGDWTDAKGVLHGPVPLAEAMVRATDKGKVVRWEVTHAVQHALLEAPSAIAMVVMSIPGSASGVAIFHSREATSPGSRPALVLAFDDGTTRRVPPIADTTLDCTTVTPSDLARRWRQAPTSGS